MTKVKVIIGVAVAALLAGGGYFLLQPLAPTPTKVIDLQKSANEGNPKAQYLLALKQLEQSHFSTSASAPALKLLEEARKKKYYPAMTLLGHMYEFGKGVKQDVEKASQYYLESARLGGLQGQYAIGRIRLDGEGQLHDLGSALGFLDKAASRQHGMAMFKLGTIYLQGEGLMNKPTYALQLFTKAANQNVIRAQVTLGLIFADGVAGIKAQPKLGYQWLALAVKRGVPENVRRVIQPRLDTIGTYMPAAERRQIDTWVDDWIKHHPEKPEPFLEDPVEPKP